jgi:hypothetical protein
MAGFSTKTFSKHDDYMTPESAWTAVKQYIPENKKIWEAFYGDGESGNILTKMGFDVIHKKVDFFKNNLGEIIVSNPPFTMKKEVLTRLKELGKPFMLIMPSSTINTQYMRKLFGNDANPIQLIIPRKRIQFIKLVNGKRMEGQKQRCNFDCFYYCWKMNLPRDLIWLETQQQQEKKQNHKIKREEASKYLKYAGQVALTHRQRRAKKHMNKVAKK